MVRVPCHFCFFSDHVIALVQFTNSTAVVDPPPEHPSTLRKGRSLVISYNGPYIRSEAAEIHPGMRIPGFISNFGFGPIVLKTSLTKLQKVWIIPQHKRNRIIPLRNCIHNQSPIDQRLVVANSSLEIDKSIQDIPKRRLNQTKPIRLRGWKHTENFTPLKVANFCLELVDILI